MNKKVIIFDFGGTYYSGEHIFCNVKKYVDAHRRQFLPNVSDDQFEMILKENPKWLEVESGKEIAKGIYKIKSDHPELEISVDDFWNVQQSEVYDINLENAHIVDIKFVENVCKKYDTYLVSNSSPKHICFYLNKFNIDPNLFKEIISNHFEEFDQSKKHYYLEIAKKEGVEPKNLYVFGDSDSSDLQPARDIGANTFLVNDSHNLPKIFDSAMKKE